MGEEPSSPSAAAAAEASSAEERDGLLNLVAIAGPARAGKSLFLSVLAQCPPGTFKVSPENESATKGMGLASRLWKLTDLKPCGSKASESSSESEDEGDGEESTLLSRIVNQQEGGAAAAAAGSTVAVAAAAAVPSPVVEISYIDTEGLGAQETTKGAAMLAPAVVLSKVVVFYWPSRPLRDSLLSGLGALLEAADALSPLPEGEQGTGHLHVVLRNQKQSNGVMAMLLREEEEEEGGGGQRARNAVRRRLCKRFRSMDVWAFPVPVKDVEALESGMIGVTDVRDEFVDAMDDLRMALVPQLAQPHQVEGTTLTRHTLSGLLKMLLERGASAGDAATTKPSSVEWEAAHAMEQRVSEDLEEYLDRLRAVIEVEKSPFLASALEHRLKEKAGALIDRLREGLQGLHNEARDHVMQSFQTKVDREIETLEGCNRQCVVNAARMAMGEAKLRYLEGVSSLTDRADEYLLQTWEETAISTYRSKMSSFYAEDPQVLRIQQDLVTFIATKREAVTQRLLSSQRTTTSSTTAIVDRRPAVTTTSKKRSAASGRGGGSRRRKVVLVGDSNVGKSWIMHWLVNGKRPNYTIVTTVGLDVHHKTFITGQYGSIDLEIWDTAGQERFSSVTPQHFRGAAAVVYVYDVGDKVSFERVTSYWMKMANLHCTGTNVFSLILANKSDRDEAQRQVTPDVAQALQAGTGINIMETSGRNGTNVLEAFMKVAEGLGQIIRAQGEDNEDRAGDRDETIRLRTRRAAEGWEKFVSQCCL